MSMTEYSSSFSDDDPKYDVFISFRGGDTRLKFTSHLYSALCQKQIETYIDEVKLEKGDDISCALPKAIEESAISIIIFSENYASSTWCLDELVHILKCKKEKAQIVLPIFLDVDPSDIRKQKKSYATAFVKHRKRFKRRLRLFCLSLVARKRFKKVQEWRQALKKASKLSGWDSRGKSESDIVDAVVKNVKEKLKHIGSNGYIEDRLKPLKTKLRSLIKVLKDAEEKQITDEDVREWLLNMKKVIFRADELTKKINYEERRKLEGISESSTSFVTFNKSVEDKIAEILVKLEELTAQKDALGLNELTENVVSQRSYAAPLFIESQVYGREDDKEAIVKLVVSDESCSDKVPVVVPIVGMGGIGKTTLAQLVFNDQRVENHFQIRVWVTISDEFDVFNITKQIFKGVTSKEFKSKEISKLQLKLSKELEGKKFLLVLDDVWNDNYHLWDELRRPFTSGASGSKIIITAHSSMFTSTMSKVEAHCLGMLSDDSCWKLFIQHALENEDLLSAHPDLRKIGEGIVKMCKGLPLAVKSVAALLRSFSPLDEWRKILENAIWNSEEDAMQHFLPFLSLSYHYLSPQLKRCFAYCSKLPQDYGFTEKEAILLWMAEGLLQTKEGTRMKDVGEEYFRILTSRSLFQQLATPDPRFFMHDLVHDFVQGHFSLQENAKKHNRIRCRL